MTLTVDEDDLTQQLGNRPTPVVDNRPLRWLSPIPETVFTDVPYDRTYTVTFTAGRR